MMRITQYLLFLLILSFTYACHLDEDNMYIPEKMPVQVEASITPQTRTSQDGSSFVEGDSFILYEGLPKSSVKQSEYAYATSAWSGKPGLFWDDLSVWNNAEIINEETLFTAVLTNGGSLTLGDTNTFVIAADQNENKEDFLKNDLLVAYGSAKVSDAADSRKLELNFKHVFAQLKIKMTEITAVGDDSPTILGESTTLSIKDAKHENSITFNNVSGVTTVSPSGSAVEITLCNVSTEGSPYEYIAILPAQSLRTATLHITNNSNGKEYTYSLNGVTVPDDGDILQQGVLTTLSLKIKKTEIVVADVMLTEWVTRESLGIATPSDYPEITIGDGDDGGDDGGLDPGDDYAGKTIKLTSNVDAATLGLPIGTKAKPFRGTFDGQGYTITNVNLIDYTLDDDAFLGVFGYTDGATIKNLNVEGNGIANRNNSTSTATGGLAGYINNTLIENCHVLKYTAGVTAAYDNAGGLVGYVNGASTIKLSSTNTTVKAAHDYAGGFVGKSEKGMILTECFSRGSVTATGYYAGGFVGYAVDGTIEYCYSWCNVYGDRFVGGLIGRANRTILNNSYVAGRTLSAASTVGGLIGYSEIDPKYCYWNAALAGGKGATGDTPDATNSSFALLKTEAAMGNILNGLNRNTVTDKWELESDADGYILPVLVNNKGDAGY